MNLKALEAALRLLSERHEILRTCYRSDGKTTTQHLLPSDAVVLRREDVSRIPEHQRSAAVWSHMNAQFQAPMRLDELPFTLTIYKHEESLNFLGGFINHVAFDGRSVGIFWSDFLALYRRCVLGLSAFAPPDLQYADFALWENGWLNDTEMSRSRTYWESVLPMEPINLPNGRPFFAPPSPVGLAPFALPKDVFHRSVEFASSQRVTLNILFLGVITTLFARWAGRDQFIVSHVFHGRPTGVANLVGCFIQSRPFCLDLSGDPTFLELMLMSRRSFIDGTNIRRPPPLDRLWDRLHSSGCALNLSHGPDIQNNGPLRRSLGLLASPPPSERPFKTETNRNVQFSLVQRPNSLDGSIMYAADRFDAAQIQSFCDTVVALIKKGITNPHFPVSALVGTDL